MIAVQTAWRQNYSCCKEWRVLWRVRVQCCINVQCSSAKHLTRSLPFEGTLKMHRPPCGYFETRLIWSTTFADFCIAP